MQIWTNPTKSDNTDFKYQASRWININDSQSMPFNNKTFIVVKTLKVQHTHLS